MSLVICAARDLFLEWTRSQTLRWHGRSVELTMRSLAARLGVDASEFDKWAISGLLHDADYEQWPEDHPHRIVGWLHEHHEPEIAHAISAHYSKWGIPAASLMDKALLAADELSGFVTACALVRPDRFQGLTSQAVLKKLKSKNFAAKVDREEVHLGSDLLGIPLEELISIVIAALAPNAGEIELPKTTAS